MSEAEGGWSPGRLYRAARTPRPGFAVPAAAQVNGVGDAGSALACADMPADVRMTSERSRRSVRNMADIHPSASVAPSAIVTGDVSVGPGSRILHGAVLNGDLGPITIGSDVLVMENAVLRGRADSPLTIGDAVLVGPHAHLNGATIEDEVFIATGVSVFADARVGTRCELRINSVLHVNSSLPQGTVLPIGWIAAGDPAQLFSPDRHDELWAVQERLDFPGTMYGASRDTPLREIMRAQSEAYRPL
jgi:carbonic anhydrase/acetyltransferase-like protein (isoleucine patch superfamily)